MMSTRSLKKCVRLLCTLTPAMSIISFTTFIAASSAPYWIHVHEKFPNKNRTVLFGPNRSSEFFEKSSYGGLWRICSTALNGEEYACQRIEYFSNKSYEPDLYDSSLVIPYSIINSAGFFFTAGSFMFLAGILFATGHYIKKRKIFTFASGVVFILSGILLFIGQIVFIAIFKAEIGGKLISKTPLSPPLVSYSYGWSFAFLILSFLSCEVTGTLALFFFIYYHQYKWSLRAGSSKGNPGTKVYKEFTAKIEANRTNGFIPNRRHSFDNMNELSTHKEDNGNKNWKFNLRENYSERRMVLPKSVLSFEEDNYPQHYHLSFEAPKNCFCHQNFCPSLQRESFYRTYVSPLILRETGGSFHASLDRRRPHSLIKGKPKSPERRKSTVFFAQDEEEIDLVRSGLSPLEISNFDDKAPSLAFPSKGILKRNYFKSQ